MNHSLSPDPFPGDPIVAELVERRRRYRFAWLLVAMVVLFVVLLIAAVLYVAIFLGSGSGAGSGDMLPARDEGSLTDKHATVAAAYNSSELGVDTRQFAQIRNLFNGVVRATKDQDDEEYRKQVDGDRMFLQIKRTGLLPGYNFWEERSLRNQLYALVTRPGNWHRYRIVHVHLSPQGHEAIVYSYCWDDADCYEMRWWILRDGKVWKLYDWEAVQFGMRNSEEWAHSLRHNETPQLDAVTAAYDAIGRADEHLADGDIDATIDELHAAEATGPYPPALAGEVKLHIAYAWSRCQRPLRLLDGCRAIQDPDAVPGFHYGQALAFEEFEQCDRALVSLNQFEEMVGGSPNVCQHKAELLEKIGSLQAAADYWLKLHRADPENVESLHNLVRLLPDERLQDIVAIVGQRRDALQLASAMATTLARQEDLKGAQQFLQLVQQIAPATPQIDFVRGSIHEAGGKYELAAASYRKALQAEPDEDTRGQYLESYLDAMTLADRLMDGYRQAPEPQAAFYYLTDLYDSGDYGIDDATLGELVAEHLRSQPDDYWGHYYRAQMLLNDGDLAGAGGAIRAGIELTEDDDALSSFRYLQTRILRQPGADIAAYQALAPAEETFKSLADPFLWNQQYDRLQELVDAHQTSYPNDPWLSFYRAKLLAHEMKFAEAERLLQAGQSGTSDDEIKDAYRSALIEVWADSGQSLRGYQESDSVDTTFEMLADHLARNERWLKLETLIARHREESGLTSDLLERIVEVNWKQHDYRQVVSSIEDFGDENLKDIEFYRLLELEDRQLRSYLRLQRLPEAIRLAQRIHDERGDARPLFLVNVRLADADRALRYADQMAAAGNSVSRYYQDEDIGSELWNDESKGLRKRYPPPVPYSVPTQQLVLLCDAAPELTLEQIQESFARHFNGLAIQDADLFPTAPPGGIQQFLVRTNAGNIGISLAGQQYVENVESVAVDIASERLAQAVRAHRGWIAVELSGGDRQDEEAALKLLLRAGRSIMDDSVVAIYLADFSRLLPNSDAVRQLLADEHPRQKLIDSGERLWMYQSASPDTDQAARESLARRNLPAFDGAFRDRGNEGRFRIQLTFRAGRLHERPWLDVLEIQGQGYRRSSYVARLVSDAKVMPRFVTGERLSVRPFDIVDWQYTVGDASQRGSQSPDPQQPDEDASTAKNTP